MAAGISASGEGTKSPIKIFANIFISFIGAGVLGLPHAFKEAGILEGCLIMIFVALVSVKAMLLVIDCKYVLIEKKNGSTRNGSAKPDQVKLLDAENGESDSEAKTKVPAGEHITYGDVGYHALGKTGQVLVDWAIILSQTGFCCAYLIFIRESLNNYMPIRQPNMWLLLLLPLEFAICLYRNLKKLAFTSLFAQISNLAAFAVVFYFDFDKFHSIQGSLALKEFSLQGFPFFLCIAIYCYEGAGMILSLEASLHEDIRHKFKPYFLITIGLVTVLYLSFGVSGYASFGSDTQDIITLNLPVPESGSISFSMIVTCCLSLSLFFTYPVMMFPVNSLLEKKLNIDSKSAIWKPVSLRLVLVSITGLVVILIPDFGHLMALIGATCCVWLAFILPAIFHMILCANVMSKWERIVDYVIIIVGISGTIVGLIDAIQRMSGGKETTMKVLSNSPPSVQTQTVTHTVEQIANATLSHINNTIITHGGQS